MNILYVYSDHPSEWNSSEWRVFIPARAMARAGHKVTLVFVDWWANEEEWEEVDSEVDIVVVQRNAVGTILNRIANTTLLHEKPVVLDLDDGYHVMPQTLKSYDFWVMGNIPTENGKHRMKYSPLEQITWASKIVTAVSSPSPYILQDWQKYTPNTFLIRNYPEAPLYTKWRTDRQRDKITWIGWGGSGTHQLSFAESKLAAAIRRVLSERKDVGFIGAGGNQELYEDLFHKSYRERFRWVNWTNYREWPSTLAQFDIGLIPLADPYDTRRSWIKPIEYGLMGIPWIGSENPMLSSLISEHGLAGDTVRANTNEWVDRILWHVDNPKQSVEMGRSNIPFCESTDVDLNTGAIEAAYKAIASI